MNQHGLGKKPRVNGMYSVDKQQVLLYSTGNYIQYHVINYNGKEYEKECVTESLCYIAAKIQHCKTAISQSVQLLSHVRLFATP